MASKLKKIILLAVLLVPIVSILAEECDPNLGYCPLAPIPQLIDQTTGTTNINTLIPGLVQLAISVAGGLAVLYIVIGGIQYMSTDAWMKKSEARHTIQNALLGLLLAISAYTILYTVNPRLVDIDFSIPGLEVSTTTLGITTINKTASEVGCTNDCEAVNKNNIPVKTPGACSNDPCYLYEGLIEELEDLADELEGEVGWQITVAYPPVVPPDSGAGCWGPGNAAGSCVIISPYTTSDLVINKFLKGIDGEIDKDDYTIVYNVCGTRLNGLKNDPDIEPNLRTYFACPDPTRPEGARINRKSLDD